MLNINSVNFILMVSNRSNKSKLADEHRDCRLLHSFLGCGGISDGSGEEKKLNPRSKTKLISKIGDSFAVISKISDSFGVF